MWGCILWGTILYVGLSQWLRGKESACSAGDAGLVPGLGRSPGGSMATHSSILVHGRSRGQRSLVGYSP